MLKYNYKLIVVTFILLLFAPSVVSASSQSLTYNNQNNQVNISYDSLNRILTKNSTAQNINYIYDVQYFGTLTNITANNETYKYEYDDNLRVIQETRTIDGIDFVKKQYYDSMGRLIKQTFSPGNSIDYYYNQQGELSKILNFVNSTCGNPFGNTLNRTYANSKLTGFTYDEENGRLTGINTDTVQQLNYSYDPVGNVIMINDSVNNRTQIMTYDFLDRLVNATINGFSYVYSYSPIGNMLKIVRGNMNTTKFVYSGNQIHAPSQIVTGGVGVDVYNLTQLLSTTKSRIFEFFLINDLNSSITGANWSFGIGNGTTIFSTGSINISTNESVMVIVAHNYTSGGSYNVNATGNYSSSSDFENKTIRFGVKAGALSLLSRNITEAVIELLIRNDMNVTSQNITWNCSNGVSSTAPFSLLGDDFMTNITTYNYSSSGIKALTCSVNSTDGNDSITMIFDIPGIRIEDYNSTSLDANMRNIQFTIKNYYYPLQANWSIESDGQTFSGTIGTIATDGYAVVSQNITYTTDGRKIVKVNITSGGMVDRYNETFALKALRIENFNSYRTIETNRTFNFTIKNYWPQALTVSWNISNPNSTKSNAATLSQGQSVSVLFRNNYTAQGRKAPIITVYNNSFNDSITDIFIIKMIEITGFSILRENQTGTIFEIAARNNVGSQNISWRLDTGQQNITSTQSMQLNKSEDVRVLVQANYTTSGIYPVTAFINSTSYNDTATGFVIA